jgi:hypothetical protein
MKVRTDLKAGKKNPAKKMAKLQKKMAKLQAKMAKAGGAGAPGADMDAEPAM